MARALKCIVFGIEIRSRIYFCSRRASCKDRLCVCSDVRQEGSRTEAAFIC
jgi:hypothetical protein